MAFLSDRDLGDETDLERLRRDLSGLDIFPPRDLAMLGRFGGNLGMALAQAYLQKRSDEFRVEYKRHFNDPSLEREHQELSWLYE